MSCMEMCEPIALYDAQMYDSGDVWMIRQINLWVNNASLWNQPYQVSACTAHNPLYCQHCCPTSLCVCVCVCVCTRVCVHAFSFLCHYACSNLFLAIQCFGINLRIIMNFCFTVISIYLNIRKSDANSSSTSTASATPWTAMMGVWTGHQWNTRSGFRVCDLDENVFDVYI